MSVAERGKLVGQEWKALSATEKKVCYSTCETDNLLISGTAIRRPIQDGQKPLLGGIQDRVWRRCPSDQDQDQTSKGFLSDEVLNFGHPQYIASLSETSALLELQATELALGDSLFCAMYYQIFRGGV